ncbi:hypothetical protein ACWF7H_27850 [Peribacillus butanolivorans]|uniref:hypothetical protein n=1 Tax=Peribacillus butanolivorans TaxID=421767 RepID=UPI0036B9BBBD
MGGLKGQLGSSSNIERPQTAKQYKDNELRKQAQRKNREYYKAYYCPNCKKKIEGPSITAVGVLYCSPCMVKYSKVFPVTETTAYRDKIDVNKLYKRKMSKKKRKK